MEKIVKEYLLTIAKKYARRHGLALTTVARRFHGTESFFEDFMAGTRSITLRKLDEMIEEFRSAWPDDLQWPELADAICKNGVKNRARL